MILQSFDYINRSHELITNGSIIQANTELFQLYLGSLFWFLLFIPMIFTLYLRTRNIGVIVFFTFLGMSEGAFSQNIDIYLHPILRIILYLGLTIVLWFAFKSRD